MTLIYAAIVLALVGVVVGFIALTRGPKQKDRRDDDKTVL